jgi:acyl-coenzyme A synthetase/AMP-(fatty) acid ligase
MQGYVPAGSDPDERTVENRWLRSGDLGRRDSDGYVFVTGRLKEIILRGGENISPGAVESALLSHPGITAAAVVGIPHRDLGEIPAAFLVVAGRLDAERVRSHVRARVGQNATPEHVFFLEALPENAIGKLDRKEMRRLACARLGIQPDGTGRENIPTIRN